MFHRDDMYRVFEALAAEIARRRQWRRQLSVGLMSYACFITEPPLVAGIPLLRAGHVGIAICPRSPCQPPREGAVHRAASDATIVRPKLPDSPPGGRPV